MIKPYGPTTDPCIILLVIAVTDEHTLFSLVLCRRSVKNDIIHFRILAGIGNFCSFDNKISIRFHDMDMF